MLDPAAWVNVVIKNGTAIFTDRVYYYKAQ